MQPLPQTLLCRYRYDPLDQLTSHILPGTSERQRFYCKNRLVTEIQGALHYSIFQQGDQLLAEHKNAGGTLDTTLLATDLQRSILHTLKADHQSQSFAYTPYGHRTIENGLISLLGFNGERLDPVSRNYLLGNGYRALNPRLMRLNSPDSLSPFGKGGLNSYAYCLGDPINQSDPTGHSPTVALSPAFRSRALAWSNRAKKRTAAKKTPSTNRESYSTLQNRDIKDFHFEHKDHLANQAKHSKKLIKSISKLTDLGTLDENTIHKFILSNNEELIIGTPIKSNFQLGSRTIELTDYMSHAVLGHYSKSRNVISAGYLTIEAFPHMTIINTSGHYQPRFRTLKPVYELLEGMDAKVTAVRHTNPYG